ncbi:MAG: malate dehydrogenase [Deltaproteobacteria bacterium]|nr:malate dehydrogenase [Deltaproteobacteria bacterium]MBN2687392.1 malate dehydrogenase [Deltaproteobacteria bacterium]
MKSKVSVIGSGFVGAMTAQRITEKNLADVALIDIIEGIPQGKALDISQSCTLEGFDAAITGTNDFSDIRGSSIVVITAGFPRTPGMTREDLVLKNGTVIRSVTEKIREYAPECIIITVTNPLDVMTHLAWKVSGFHEHRVMGMGGVLDTARYKYFLARELDVSIKDIDALVLGSHGDTMVPIAGYTTVKGVPVSQFMNKDRLDAIIERTKKGGAEIVQLLRSGSAWHAPSASIVAMVEAILRDSKRVMPVSAYLRGEYGIVDVHIGVPVKLGSSGVEEIFEIELTDEELAALRESADAIKETIGKLTIL